MGKQRRDPRDERKSRDAPTEQWEALSRPAELRSTDITQPHEIETVSQSEGATDTSPRTSGKTVALGEDFGEYEILEQIARGGMGVVFKARQKKANRIVALKMILSGQLADAKEVERFHKEAEAAANLDHPGIVPIYDVGEVSGQHYFSMGFVDGKSLSDYASDGPLPTREAATLLKAIAEAIAFAHANGVIHRDLKPANILLDKQGRPRVTDFGLAKQMNAQDGLTATGQIMGTPRYMPPEQAMGRTAEIGEASDVYSLGAILYELLTGRPPFQAAAMHDILAQVVKQDPVPIRRLNSAVDRDLETIALKCLQKQASARYRSADALAGDLDAYLAGRPISARPISTAARLMLWCRRHPTAAFAVALSVVAIVLAVGLAIGYGYQQRLTTSLEQQQELGTRLQDSVTEATALRRHAEQQEQLAKRLSYIADINLAHRLWDDNELQRTREMLDQLGSDADNVRGFEWDYLQRLCRPERLVIRPTSDPLDTSLSADGRFLAIGTAAGIELLSMPDGQRIKTLSTGQPASRVAFNRQSTMLAATGLDGVSAWHTDDWREAFNRDDLHLAKTKPAPLAWSSSGETLAVSVASNRNIAMMDPSSGEIRTEVELEAGLGRIGQVEFEPASESSVAIMCHNSLLGSTLHTYLVWDVETGKRREAKLGKYRIPRILAATKGFTALSGDNNDIVLNARGDAFRMLGHQDRINALAFGSDGEQLVSASDDATLIVWDTRLATPLHTLRGHLDPVVDVEVSPDFKSIVSLSLDGTVRVWDGDRDARFLQLQRPGAYLANRSLHWAADCRYLTALLNRGFLIADRNGAVLRFNRPAGDRSNSLAASPTSKLCLSGLSAPEPNTAKTATYALHNWSTGAELKRFDMGDTITASAFDASGERLAISARNGSVQVYDTNTQQLVHTLSLSGDFETELLQFGPQGNWLAASGSGGLIAWPLSQGTSPNGQVLVDESVDRLVFSKNGDALAATGKNGVFAWLMDQPAARLYLETDANPRSRPLQFTSDGSILAVANASSIHLWKLRDPGDSVRVETADPAEKIEYTLDQRHLLTAEGEVITMRTLDGKEVHQLSGHSKAVTAMAVHPDGVRLASGGKDRTIRIWDLKTGREMLNLEGHPDTIRKLLFSPDGRQLASAGDHGAIHLWDATPIGATEK